jgi:hypothetical protein
MVPDMAAELRPTGQYSLWPCSCIGLATGVFAPSYRRIVRLEHGNPESDRDGSHDNRTILDDGEAVTTRMHRYRRQRAGPVRVFALTA